MFRNKKLLLNIVSTTPIHQSGLPVDYN